MEGLDESFMAIFISVTVFYVKRNRTRPSSRSPGRWLDRRIPASGLTAAARKARIPPHRLMQSRGDPREVRVLRVDEEVALDPGDEARDDEEKGSALPVPCLAETLRRRAARVIPSR